MRMETISHDLATFLRDIAQRTPAYRAIYPRKSDAPTEDKLAQDMSDLDMIEKQGVVTLYDRCFVNDQQAFVSVELTVEGSRLLRELYSISDPDQ